MPNTWNINGTNNTFGIDSAAWNSIRTSEKLAVGRQYAAEHGWEPISPLNTPMYYGYIDGGYYDDYGNLLEVSGGGGPVGVGTGGMNAVGPPNSGGGAGSVGSGYGYAQPGAGLSPLAPGTGQGQGIYDDASMYRGGDFWGGGSDPYAGTGYAGGGSGGGGGGGAPSWNATPYDGFTGVNELGDYYTRTNELGDPIYNGWYTDLGLPVGANDYGQPSPAFDYNAMNSPSFNGNWGDAAYAFNPTAGMSQWGGIPDTTGGQGFEAGKDQSQFPQNLYQPTPDWLRDASRTFSTNPDPWQRIIEDAQMNRGGIGSDALRDSMAWTLATSSPYAENANIPSRPTANQGYNPGMENWFANPGMNQFNPAPYQQQLQDILRGIDQGTGNQNLDPNWLVPGGGGPGGRSYYQGDNNTPLISSGG